VEDHQINRRAIGIRRLQHDGGRRLERTAALGLEPMAALSFKMRRRQFVAVATGAAPGGSRPGGAILAFALPIQ
jgi:hypothetical protein